MISISSVLRALDTLLSLPLRRLDDQVSLMCVFRRFGYSGRDSDVSKQNAILGIMREAMFRHVGVDVDVDVLMPLEQKTIEELRSSASMNATRALFPPFLVSYSICHFRKRRRLLV